MARTFNGRASEELYNEELYKLFEIIKHVADEPDDPTMGPLAKRDGALWLDRNIGDLKFKEDGVWKTVFNDKLKMIAEILSPDEPRSPVSGQLWLNDGILTYFSGGEWLPVKAVNISKEFNLSGFEDFLIISPIDAAGKKVVNMDTEIDPSKRIYNEEVFHVTNTVRTYEIQGTFKMDANAVNVYIEGLKLPRSFYEEKSNNKIEILKDIIEDRVATPTNKILVSIEYLRDTGDSKDDLPTIMSMSHEEQNLPIGASIEADKIKSQFLLPSAKHDKFFINGMHTDDYTVSSDVSIEYPSEDLQGKFASAVHINPKRLINVKKRFFDIVKGTGNETATGLINANIISAPEGNTEFYGIGKGIGKILLKAKGPESQYSSVAQGIRLSLDTINTFDFIETITYGFKNIYGTGELIKGKTRLSETTSVYVGDITDPLCVFAQGLYLDEDPDNYVYEDGFIKLKLETTMDIGVISFPKKEIGTIFDLDNKKRAIVNINKDYLRQLVFVYGENLEWSLADYETDPSNDKRIFIKNAQIGMKYAVVETKTTAPDPEEEMFYKAGIIEKDPITGQLYIPIDSNTLLDDTDVILFVNGLLMAKNDVEIDTANDRIDIYGGFAEGNEYVLLKDEYGRFIFSDHVSFNTIPLKHMSDTTVVYIENQLISDAAAVYVSRLPDRGYPREVKKLLRGDIQNWYMYGKTGWELVEDEDKITLLEARSAGYISNDRSINILKNFGKKDCSYYSYQYANSIEEPLLRGNIRTYEGRKEYRTAFNHSFESNKNALSIWRNGLRQYHDTTGNLEDMNGYIETGESKFQIVDPIDGMLFYVVERPEGTEEKSCDRQILRQEDIIAGTNNVFSTDISLIPGNVRLFVSGLRQPSSSFRILDKNRIMLKDEILCYENNFPTESIQMDGGFVDFTRTHPDSILIEVRQDYSLKEITVPVRYAGQNRWSIEPRNSSDPYQGGDNIPETIIFSKDFVMIYINGLAYGKDYRIDRELGEILLTNEDVTSRLGVDPIEEYFKENPEEHKKWIKENGSEYVAKPITDKITFEWR